MEIPVPEQSPLFPAGERQPPAPPTAEGWDDGHYGDHVPESLEPEPHLDDDMDDLLAGAPLPDEAAPSAPLAAAGSTGDRMAKAFEPLKQFAQRGLLSSSESEIPPEQRVRRASDNFASIHSIVKLASLSPNVRFDAYAEHLPKETVLAIRQLMNDLGLSPQNETVVMSMLFGHVLALADAIPGAIDRSTADFELRFQAGLVEFVNILGQCLAEARSISEEALAQAQAISDEANAKQEERHEAFTTRISAVLGQEVLTVLDTTLKTIEAKGRGEVVNVNAAAAEAVAAIRGAGLTVTGNIDIAVEQALKKFGAPTSVATFKESESTATLERWKAYAWGALFGAGAMVLLFGIAKLIHL